jgi:hypothetical protein
MVGLANSLVRQRDEEAEAPRRQDKAALAAYIVEMTAELARLAGDAGMPMLAYFLNLARVEAQIAVRESDSPLLHRRM